MSVPSRPILRYHGGKFRLAMADGARERVEVIWLNEAAQKAIENESRQLRMFA